MPYFCNLWSQEGKISYVSFPTETKRPYRIVVVIGGHENVQI
jgi:hypothetical protein